MIRVATVQLRNPRTVGACPHGSESRLSAGGWICVHDQPEQPEPLRPAGHGTGLDGPACPERIRPQFPDADGPFRTRCCIRCGRITARLDLDGVGWCGGVLAGAKPARRLTLVGA